MSLTLEHAAVDVNAPVPMDVTPVGASEQGVSPEAVDAVINAASQVLKELPPQEAIAIIATVAQRAQEQQQQQSAGEGVATSREKGPGPMSNPAIVCTAIASVAFVMGLMLLGRATERSADNLKQGLWGIGSRSVRRWFRLAGAKKDSKEDK